MKKIDPYQIFEMYLKMKLEYFENDKREELFHNTMELASALVGNVLDMVKEDQLDELFKILANNSLYNHQVTIEENKNIPALFEKMEYVANGGMVQ